jgi:hypothetical protein
MSTNPSVASRLRAIPTLLAALLLLVATSLGATPAAKPPAGKGVSAEQRVQILQKQLREADARLQKFTDERKRIDTEYARKYYDHMGKRLDMNLAQLRWQLSASEKMLWVVVVVVFSGLVFSGFQLWKSTSLKHLGGETTVVIEAQRIRMRSSVVGVVVLAISMVFFYAFLIEVYRRRVVDLSRSVVPPSSRAASAPAVRAEPPRGADAGNAKEPGEKE